MNATTNPATWTALEASLRTLCLLATGACGENAIRALADKAARLSATQLAGLTPDCRALVAATLEAA